MGSRAPPASLQGVGVPSECPHRRQALLRSPARQAAFIAEPGGHVGSISAATSHPRLNPAADEGWDALRTCVFLLEEPHVHKARLQRHPGRLQASAHLPAAWQACSARVRVWSESRAAVPPLFSACTRPARSREKRCAMPAACAGRLVTAPPPAPPAGRSLALLPLLPQAAVQCAAARQGTFWHQARQSER